jgi:hypothetical protein
MKNSKELSKKQPGSGNSAELATNSNDSAMDHAQAAVSAAELGASIIGELETFLCTVAVLLNGDELDHDGMRKRMDATRGIVRLAVHFASERSEDYEFVCNDLNEALATLRSAA